MIFSFRKMMIREQEINRMQNAFPWQHAPGVGKSPQEE